jgi:hypothetical protein
MPKLGVCVKTKGPTVRVVGVSKGLQLPVTGVTGSVTGTVVSTTPIPDRQKDNDSKSDRIKKRATTCIP